VGDLIAGQPARGSTSGRPIMVLLDALGRRGALRVLWELRESRQLTFRHLLEACASNPGALNTRLKELRDIGLVEHQAGGYLLTVHGREVAKLLTSLHQAAERWARAPGARTCR
jgi:DNA-binding HxlR family transcriptional regulator